MTKQEVCRVIDFVQFHNESCLADTIVGPLSEYLKLAGYDNQQMKEEAVLLYSLTYSVPTTIVLLENIEEINNDPELFWQKNKEKLIFQSDRKYVKMNNSFVGAYRDFKKRKIFDKLRGKKILDFNDTVKLVEQCYGFGRFSAFLFIETYDAIFECEFTDNKLDWEHGSTVTSGMFNVLGEDELANIWDKTHKIAIDIEYFDHLANQLLKKVKIGKKLAVLETNLCAYRKLFKGTRYIGYYSDRVLQELYRTIANFPEHKDKLKLLFLAREAIIPAKYLGEKQGWTGIRKELKKYYLENGDWRW